MRNIEDCSIGVKDMASTYLLHPCQRTRLSLILEDTSRGDTRGLYCQEGE